MKLCNIFARALYIGLAKHMPLSDSKCSFGAKRLRRFCARAVIPHCGKNEAFMRCDPQTGSTGSAASLYNDGTVPTSA